MIGVLSLAVIALILFGGTFGLKALQGGFTLFKDSKQDDAIVELNEKVDELDRQISIVLDVVLETTEIDSGELSRRLLTK